MGAARILATLTAGAAIVGCIVVAARLGTATDEPAPTAAFGGRSSSAPVATYPPAPREPVRATAVRSGPPGPASTTAVVAATGRAATSAPPRSTPAARTRPAPPATTPAAEKARAAATRSAKSATTKITPTKAKPTTAAPAATKPKKRGIALPLGYATGNATRVITVTATSRNRTVAHLQAWYKAPGGGWLHYGKAVTAHIGAAGMTPAPNEGMSATPMGSFTLTQAFGRLPDPGTALPYFKTRPSDWWISQSGSLYNTHQRCASQCGFNQGAPNEHLYYETPYYNYAVVIDYNTRNAPGGVHQGAGSAFFLHVYPPGTGPTAGCVSIPQSKLVTLMRWLHPATHPRILIGVPR